MEGTQEDILHRTRQRRALWLALGIAIVAATIGLVAPFLLHKAGFADWGSTAGLHGQLSLTMTAAGLVAPYAFDFDQARLIHARRVDGEFFLQGVVASTTGNVAYRCTDKASGQQAICVYVPASRKHVVISRNAFAMKRYLQWSPDASSVLYAAFVASSTPEQSYDPNEWALFLAKADGSGTRQVAMGSVGFFAPDGRSVVSLGRAGLYQTWLASSSKPALVWPVQGGLANRYMMVVVSGDGTKLAWSNPYSGGAKGKLSLFDIVSWEPFTLSYKTDLSMRVWQLQFSPDGQTLALSADASDGRPGLFIYSPGKAPRKVLDLQAYERKTYLTQWR